MLIKIQAYGICHSDVLTKEGQWPGLEYPRVLSEEPVEVPIAQFIMGRNSVQGWRRARRRILRTRSLSARYPESNR